MQVGKLQVKPLPVSVPAKYAHLVPQRGHLEVSLGISGVHSSVSNAIRRVLVSELPIIGFTCEYSEIVTNDQHVAQNIEMILSRLEQIPVDQDTPLSNIYEIDYTNKSTTCEPVFMGELRQIAGAKRAGIPCEKRTELVCIQPGRHFKCKIHVDQKVTGRRAVAANVVSVLTNQDAALNTFEGTGTAAAMSDHRHWTIRFITNGTAPPDAIIKAACNNLRSRLARVSENVKVVLKGKEYHAKIDDNRTIGDIIVGQIYEAEPNISALALDDTDADAVVIRMIVDTEPLELINGAINNCEKILSLISDGAH